MSDLWIAPFLLIRGSTITAVVMAENNYGWSGESLPNSQSVLVETKPSTPGSPIRVDSLTNQSQITVSWSLFTTDDQTGGSPISAYTLMWDQGSSGLSYTQMYSGTDSSYTQSSGIIEGTTYLITLKATNTFGDSPNSTPLSIIAATNPSAPGTVVTSLVSDKVRISWSASSGNGAYLTKYSIYIKLGKGSSSYLEEQTYCNGVTLSALAAPYCDVPMSYLTAASPYGYIQGEIIVSKIVAYNVIGTSAESIPNVSGIAGQVVPWTPSYTPQKVYATKTSISISMPTITGDLTGGSAITSYNLQYKVTGSISSFISLTGEIPSSTSTTYIKSGLVAGTSYDFIYRAKNIYGWSSFSNSISIIAATIPATPLAPTLTLSNGKDVLVSWTAPDNGGNAITGYKVLFKDSTGAFQENSVE